MFLLSIFSSTLLYLNPKTLSNFFLSLFSHPIVHFFLIFLFSFSFTFLHTKHHPLHHILVKDFKIFKTRSSAGVVLLLLLSLADLLSKEHSWFAISRPWTSSSIAFFLLEGKLSGQVHPIVVCVSFSVFWDFCILCICDCLLSFESLVFELFFYQPMWSKARGFFEIRYVRRKSKKKKKKVEKRRRRRCSVERLVLKMRWEESVRWAIDVDLSRGKIGFSIKCLANLVIEDSLSTIIFMNAH